MLRMSGPKPWGLSSQAYTHRRRMRMLVIKLGGGSGMDIAACCDDIAALWQAGERMVIVHGGAGETTELGERLCHPARVVQSPSGITRRYSDRGPPEILATACAGPRNLMPGGAITQR